MKRSLLLTTALLAGLAATLVVAQDVETPAPDAPPSTRPAPPADAPFGPGWLDFATLDADGDGLVTGAELVAAREARFAAADGDGDGALSQAELVAAAEADAAARRAAMVARMIEARDDDGDGLLQPDELGPADRMAALFERLDGDGDGAVSAAEAEAMQDRMAGPGGRHEHGREGGHGGFRGFFGGRG